MCECKGGYGHRRKRDRGIGIGRDTSDDIVGIKLWEWNGGSNYQNPPYLSYRKLDSAICRKQTTETAPQAYAKNPLPAR